MARKHIVIRSINSNDGHICVDVFRVCDSGFGFEEYRRDTEDPRGWFPIGHYGSQRYATADEALEVARTTIPWLDLETPAT